MLCGYLYILTVAAIPCYSKPFRTVTLISCNTCMSLCSASDDFESASGTLTFTSDATEACFTVTIVDDSIRESAPECFTVSIIDATGDIVSPTMATACIEDNDGNTFFTPV